MPQPLGYLSIVLHAHLPYVRHPEKAKCLEELWLMEAITETYIPLIWVLEGLLHDGVDFRLAMSITPTLASMLADDFLQRRYIKHINDLQELAAKEVKRTRHQPRLQTVALMYLEHFQAAQNLFEKYHGRLLDAFRHIARTGKLEILASAATHGYLPLLSINPKAVEAQIAVGVATYKRDFGRDPEGFWLPECGFVPGIEQILARYGIRYFLTDSHGLIHGEPKPLSSVYAPIYTPAKVAAFGRDWESSKQVWSATEGYPGDYYYRDFYRDIGFDLDYDYIRPYLVEGIRGFTGIKYHRITGPTGHKEIYEPDIARERAAEHGGNFMFNRELQIRHLAPQMTRPPLVVAPYDAELFGHWWHEGPKWLDYLFRKTAYDQNVFAMITPGEYLKRYPQGQIGIPSESSWGSGGYHEVWLDRSNTWIYRHLHKAADRMGDMASKHRHATGTLRRALNQAARELLLAQASDWAFIMKTDTMVEYAISRTKTHLVNFIALHEEVSKQQINEAKLQELESHNNIFPELDFAIYAHGAG